MLSRKFHRWDLKSSSCDRVQSEVRIEDNHHQPISIHHSIIRQLDHWILYGRSAPLNHSAGLVLLQLEQCGVFHKSMLYQILQTTPRLLIHVQHASLGRKNYPSNLITDKLKHNQDGRVRISLGYMVKSVQNLKMFLDHDQA